LEVLFDMTTGASASFLSLTHFTVAFMLSPLFFFGFPFGQRPFAAV